MKHKEPIWPYLVNIGIWLSVMVLLFVLSGCSYIGLAWDKGAAANDKALGAAEAVICKGASIGSIQRRYGKTEAQAASWRALCVDSGLIVK